MSALGITLYVIGSAFASFVMAGYAGLWLLTTFYLVQKPEWARAREMMVECMYRIFGPSLFILVLYVAGIFDIRSTATFFRYTPTDTFQYDLLLVIHVLIFVVVTEFFAVINVATKSGYVRGFIYVFTAGCVYLQGTQSDPTLYVFSSIGVGLSALAMLAILSFGRTHTMTIAINGIIYFLYGAVFTLFGLLRGPNVGSVTDFVYMLLDVICYGIVVVVGAIIIFVMVPQLKDKAGRSLFFMKDGDVWEARPATAMRAAEAVRNLTKRVN